MKNVLLLGDSICISYREKVKELLRGRSRMEKVRIGILGCGNVSREYVEAAQGPYARQMEIVAAADIRAEAARELADRYGIPKAVTPDELLADPQV